MLTVLLSTMLWHTMTDPLVGLPGEEECEIVLKMNCAWREAANKRLEGEVNLREREKLMNKIAESNLIWEAWHDLLKARRCPYDSVSTFSRPDWVRIEIGEQRWFLRAMPWPTPLGD